jgi:hypothetical protein
MSPLTPADFADLGVVPDIPYRNARVTPADSIDFQPYSNLYSNQHRKAAQALGLPCSSNQAGQPAPRGAYRVPASGDEQDPKCHPPGAVALARKHNAVLSDRVGFDEMSPVQRTKLRLKLLKSSCEYAVLGFAQPQHKYAKSGR